MLALLLACSLQSPVQCPCDPCPCAGPTYQQGAAFTRDNPQYPLVTVAGKFKPSDEMLASKYDRVIAYDTTGTVPSGLWVSMWVNGRHVGVRLDPDAGDTIDSAVDRLRCPGGRCCR